MDSVCELIDRELKARYPLGGGWAWLARSLELGDTGDQVVNNWKRRGVPAARYATIADALGWSADVLTLKIPPPKWRGRKNSLTSLPEFSYAGAITNSLRLTVLGEVKLNDDGSYTEIETATAGYVEHFSDDKNAYGIRVRGDALHPAIKHGQVVVVEPKGALVAGESVLVALADGRRFIKELVTERADSITLISLIGGERMTVQRNDVECIHAVAAVVSASKWRPD